MRDIAFGLRGEFYVSDGYDNRRVARFEKDLKFLGQWGSRANKEKIEIFFLNARAEKRKALN